MGMNVERYKGIEFVRISSLPKEQQNQVWASFERDKIIKIIRDESLLNDCILVNDFAAWQAQFQAPAPEQPSSHNPILGKLAFE
jgi:hypothetical protein